MTAVWTKSQVSVPGRIFGTHTNQRLPTAWRHGRAASTRSGVKHCTPEHGDVVDVDAPLCEQFLDVAIREPVAQVPAHSEDDDLRREPEPLKAELVTL
jgi:hypothetical protein